MVIYIDENLSPSLAEALDVFEQREPDNVRVSVRCIQKHFAKGFKDKKLIPIMGREKALWITLDKGLLHKKAELKLILRYKVGVILLSQYWSSQKHWEKVKLIISKWVEIKDLLGEARPFAYKVDGNGNFTRVDKI
jgi:hypothetical protein